MCFAFRALLSSTSSDSPSEAALVRTKVFHPLIEATAPRPLRAGIPLSSLHFMNAFAISVVRVARKSAAVEIFIEASKNSLFDDDNASKGFIEALFLIRGGCLETLLDFRSESFVEALFLKRGDSFETLLDVRLSFKLGPISPTL
ncbi:unnamed protein product [Pseudo-nitzschia multistriata]|uniref:Uncharacterized protein n=1 Tax=Pseudo-nitzschia multistriata TaxID=183589 RepID=A0A448Z3B3_9STRA|nr:unnamed protein product [Pseudo-nitzschia multistriata]